MCGTRFSRISSPSQSDDRPDLSSTKRRVRRLDEMRHYAAPATPRYSTGTAADPAEAKVCRRWGSPLPVYRGFQICVPLPEIEMATVGRGVQRGAWLTQNTHLPPTMVGARHRRLTDTVRGATKHLVGVRDRVSQHLPGTALPHGSAACTGRNRRELTPCQQPDHAPIRHRKPRWAGTRAPTVIR